MKAVKDRSEYSTDFDEHLQSLSPLEKFLASKIKMVRIKGKQGKGITVLFEHEDFQLLNLLLEDPELAKDMFMFQSTGEGPYRSHKLLDELCGSLDLEKPDKIR